MANKEMVMFCVAVVLMVTVELTRAGVCDLDKKYPVYGLPINVTLVVLNTLQPPLFNYGQKVLMQPQTYLISTLSAAADVNKGFLYSGQYFSTLGLKITSINKLAAEEKITHWQILDQYFILLKCGVSSFVPFNDDTITFNYTTD
ncbi:hypothetical protein Btru_016924 [Bulinus truncatus]|nr:hypothetical protein Btru_016924 [Bulinus truncatus]